MDNQQGPVVYHMELCSMLCGSLDGRGVWERMDTCICMDQRSNCQHPLDHQKSKSSRKTSTSALLTMPSLCVDHNKLWKILQGMGISDHLTCLLRNLYTGQEATVRTGHGTTDWFQIGKGVRQDCILSPCLLICRVHHEKHWAG